MSPWRALTRGLRALARRSAVDRELDEELRHFHDEAAGLWIERGCSAEEARRRARWELGDPLNAREDVRASGWESAVETLAADLRYAARMLRKSPVFTLVVLLVLSLGCGAVTTIFSAVNAFLLRPLPGARDAERLVELDRTRADGEGRTSASYDFYRTLREGTKTLSGLAAWSKVSLSIAPGSEGISVYGNIVSGNYFSVLGVRPRLGRFFVPEEDGAPLAHPVVVVSEGFWRSHLGEDPMAVGRIVRVNGRPYTLVGVAAAPFRGVFTPLQVDAWVPLAMQPHLRPGRDLTAAPWLRLAGRLGEGASLESARSELGALTSAWVASSGEDAEGREVSALRVTRLTGLPDDARRAAITFLGLLLGASLVVLVIASIDVASMLSARALTRWREMAIRTALGAARARLIRQLLTETLLLFVLGAIGGLAVAVLATSALERLRVPSDASLILELSPDLRVLVFSLLLSLATGLVFGLAPALRGVRREIAVRLPADSGSGGVRRRLLGNTLIVGQLALSLALLVAAGLFLRTLALGAGVDPGFDAAGVVTAKLDTESWGYDEARSREFLLGLRRRLEGLPGVERVSFADLLPLTLASSGGTIEFARGEAAEVRIADVSPGYFRTIRQPLLYGRSMEDRDDGAAPRVAVVNESLARRFGPGGSAVGQTLALSGEHLTIVGVVRDAKYASLTEATPPVLYLTLAQQWRADQQLLIRSAGASGLAAALRREMHGLDPLAPVPELVSLKRVTRTALLPQRVTATVTGALGGVGLLLATAGLYGLVAYSVSRRTREIGLRMALGAGRPDVVRKIVGEGMRLAVTGVLLGLLLALAATRLMKGFLFGVGPLDTVTFVGMSVLFLAIALLASYLPARRAASTEPMAALRFD